MHPVMRRTCVAALLAVALAPTVAMRPPAARLDTYPKNPNIDALHYAFRLELSDSTDAIRGELALSLRFLAPGERTVRLDLVNAGARHGDKGMRVAGVTVDGAPARFTHTDDVLLVSLAAPSAAQQRIQLVVRYEGTPANGLRVGTNRHGDRTFFSDNWPDRARHWLPTIDHPSDKASSEFIVSAPSHYQVVSNGVSVEVTDLPGNRRRTHWRNAVPIAPWLYVLGVARFAMERVDTFEGKAIETWVYPQDREAGFAAFATPTRQALAFYLRGVVGDDAFRRGIRTYYQRHFNANATTADFRRAMEEAAGRDLGWFFDQWLYRPGDLTVAGRWHYDAAARQLRLTLEQVQGDGSLFTMPLEVAVVQPGQPRPTIHRVELTGRSQQFTIDMPTEPAAVRLDPNRWVLMEATLTKGR
ncbi:MAG: hypothetical protein RLZ32_2710 [Gemmatimonadota bacterium]